MNNVFVDPEDLKTNLMSILIAKEKIVKKEPEENKEFLFMEYLNYISLLIIKSMRLISSLLIMNSLQRENNSRSIPFKRRKL